MPPHAVHTVHTAIIGKSLPDIVGRCIDNNYDVCSKNGIPFDIHFLRRDHEFSSPGIQVEFFKAEFMSRKENMNSIFIDWDVRLINIPQGLFQDYIYFGRWYTKGSKLFDSFVIFPGEFCNRFMVELNERMKKFSKKRFGNFFYCIRDLYGTGGGLIKPFPDECYQHFHTNCGNNSIKNTYTEMSEEFKESINSGVRVPWLER